MAALSESRDFVAERACPACFGIAARTVGPLENTKLGHYLRSSYELLHCLECDVVYLSPLPPASDLHSIYMEEVQFDFYTEESSSAVVEFAKGRMVTLMWRLGLSGRAPRVLEIGAGPAWMARAAKMIAPKSVTVGQDITSEMAGKSPWVDHYLVVPAEDPKIAALGPYDVISMTHVIEHLPDPVATLKLLHPLTRGLVFLTAPHRPVHWDGSIEKWREYSLNHVPGHLQYFSERGMKAAAEASGFEVDYWDGTPEQGQSFEAWLRPSGRI